MPISFSNETLSFQTLQIPIDELMVSNTNNDDDDAEYYAFELIVTQTTMANSYASTQYVLFEVNFPQPQALSSQIVSKSLNSDDSALVFVTDLFYFSYTSDLAQIGSLYDIVWNCQCISLNDTNNVNGADYDPQQLYSMFELNNGDSCSLVCNKFPSLGFVGLETFCFANCLTTHDYFLFCFCLVLRVNVHAICFGMFF